MNNDFNSEWVNECLKDLGLSRADFGEAIGKSQSTISRWFKNGDFPVWVVSELKNRLSQADVSDPTSTIYPDIATDGIWGTGVGLSACVQRCVKQLEDISNGDIELVSTGFQTMDDNWYNWASGGSLIIVAAKTGDGKTAFALSII